jgi:arsenite oxidase small subunit
MERRDFVRVCAAGLTATSVPLAAAGPATPKRYTRAKLLDANGAPLKASALAVNKNYVFFYPFQGTPCFLLNLGKALKPAPINGSGGAAYQWPGGAGYTQSVVAYSAICSHQLTYPTKDISFISFRAGKSPVNKHADVIHCCSEHSQYDPAHGARVLAGPAPQPLAAILLEHDTATDELVAVGTLGGEVFNEFFRKYDMKLTLDMGGRAKQATGDTCSVTELDNYCRQQVRC